MNSLRALLTSPVQWNVDGVQGELFVYGDLRNNRLRFCFRFKPESHPIPLMVYYTDGEKQYKSSLSIMNDEETSADSFIFNPSFLLTKGWGITKITSLIKTSEGENE